MSMKRLCAGFVFTAVIAMSAIVIGQNPPPLQPGPELKKLDYFAGNWKSDGEMKPGPFGPGGKISGTDHNEWMKGGFFLLSHSTNISAMGSETSLGIFGYDNDKKVYTFDEFNSSGESVHATGTVDGDTWTWTSEDKNGKGRFSVKVLSPTSYSFKFELEPGGGNWITIVEGKATKQ